MKAAPADLIRELATPDGFAARAVAQRVSCLQHEALDDTAGRSGSDEQYSRCTVSQENKRSPAVVGWGRRGAQAAALGVT